METIPLLTEARVRELLKENFPPYAGSHMVWALKKNDVFDGKPLFFVGYRAGLQPSDACFNLQLERGEGTIIAFSVGEEARKQGHGERLYDVIKAICREYGCARVSVEPSKNDSAFWSALGFTPCKGSELEARLAS